MKEHPLVLCLTNTVAANFTANCLLAIGAKPAMIEDESEAAELAAASDAILVNLGTVTPQQAKAMQAAVQVARERGIPWVLDPVGIQALTYRRNLAKALIEQKPSIIRGNTKEIEFLLGSVPKGVRGSVPRGVALATGEVDRVSEGEKVQEIMGGVPMLQAVTATGCAQGGVCAALLGEGLSPWNAAVSASKLMKTAGEIAWKKSQTPGSFQVALVDALYELTQGKGANA